MERPSLPEAKGIRVEARAHLRGRRHCLLDRKRKLLDGLPHDLGMFGFITTFNFYFAKAGGVFDDHAASFPATGMKAIERLFQAQRLNEFIGQNDTALN